MRGTASPEDRHSLLNPDKSSCPMENIAYFYLPVEQTPANADQASSKPKAPATNQPKPPKIATDREPTPSVDDTLPTYPTLYL